MWWCVKRFMLVVALALQSLVVVVLWTRLFDLNVSRPSWQTAMIRWSVPAVWITSIVFWQLVFGKRRWIGMTLTTIENVLIASVLLVAGLACCALAQKSIQATMVGRWRKSMFESLTRMACLSRTQGGITTVVTVVA